jgi:NADH-quinone oxidoreductase subunit G
MAMRAAFPPGDARDDWSILRALSTVLGSQLPFDTIEQLRAGLYEAHPHLQRIDNVEPADAADIAKIRSSGTLGSDPFVNAIDDFYLTNPIARASSVMAECSALANGFRAEAAE